MAKGFAKGQIFNCVTGAGKCLLAGDGNAATGQAAADNPNAPQQVDNKQGSASTDGLPQFKGVRDWYREGGLQISKLSAEEAVVFKAQATEARGGIKDFLSKLNSNDTDFKNEVAQFYGLSGAGDRDFSILQDGLNTHGNEVMRLIDNAINNTSSVFRMAGSSHGAATGGRVFLGDPFWKGIQQAGTIIHEFSHVAGTGHNDSWTPELALKGLPGMRRDVLYQMPGTSDRLISLDRNIKNTYFFEFAVTRL
ncbi:hypothetical protein AEST_02730 [Alishewanella aestuarii B11]|uniref:Lysine-specific metallo-endopeptidase domain-containing protein n=2 Tax=Alishewanella aestuarii TaxID=453835 RepID=J2IHK1_9ALTE|nr:hypothetical protein AEST_02730 [Alishewanella aestuarii B11]